MAILGLLHDCKFWSQLWGFLTASALNGWIEFFPDFTPCVFSCLITTSRASRTVVKMCCLALELWEEVCRFTTEYDTGYLQGFCRCPLSDCVHSLLCL